jgi:DNA helicase II / ATP-dependent DNA helicase PcrA
VKDSAELLLDSLTGGQRTAVRSTKKNLLVIAGAGSGKTEVMARRIAWWIAKEGVPKEKIIAFTFTERAAEEMKFRIRSWVDKITPAGEEVSLGGMYVGTIHGFCLAKIREYWPDNFHNYDILDESARAALVLRAYGNLLGLSSLQQKTQSGQYATLTDFLFAYDQLQEHNHFSVALPSSRAPFQLGAEEQEWCKQAVLDTDVGDSEQAKAFASSAARYYAYLRCRRFLDFSTSQSEFVRQVQGSQRVAKLIKEQSFHLVVDEVQDINPIQRKIIELLATGAGKLTMVGDHRQSIYGFRGSKVEIVSELWHRFQKADDSEVVDLEENFRSTPRVIDLANRWASTIGALGSMTTPPMKHGTPARLDQHDSHVGLLGFDSRQEEAEWIAKAINAIAPGNKKGAVHDKRGGGERGIGFSDIAVLVRSSTDVRTYKHALEAKGIPCVVRAGPDLFSQPEVLLFLSALAIAAKMDEFFGNEDRAKSLPNRIKQVLGCGYKPHEVARAAGAELRRAGLPFSRQTENRLISAASAMSARISSNVRLSAKEAAVFRSPKTREFLGSGAEIRRVFPQQLFHSLLAEAEVDRWDEMAGLGHAALFHVGALSQLITGLETPGWTSARDFHWQVIGLCQFGAESGRAEEQPLMVQPDAVSISTIHAVKGLEFPAVFVADICAARFPSIRARVQAKLPLDKTALDAIDVASLADNANYDGERRLMYVALTRAERFLFVTHSGAKTSRFIKELTPIVAAAGGQTMTTAAQVLKQLRYAPVEHTRTVRLSTSFSDLRYYLECPHDFYLRKVLGFSPTIDQAFGYGRGVHNLMRAIHSDPKRWAALAKNPGALALEVQSLIDSGLFYLRYTTGEPADNMRAKGMQVATAYVKRYAAELEQVTFEPEKEFETLIDYEDGAGGVLISGAIDVVRQDNPPRVTLIDFKSGDPESDKHQKLDDEEMRLQVALYALAAKKELEYEPERGLVRYLDAKSEEKSELPVNLDSGSLAAAKGLVAATAASIRDRKFGDGPSDKKGGHKRCPNCDFLGFCGMPHAMKAKAA